MGKPDKWLFCNQVRDDNDSDQNKVVVKKAVESGQITCIFKTKPSACSWWDECGYKRKGEQRMMPKLGAYTTGNMELSSIGVSMETIPSVIG